MIGEKKRLSRKGQVTIFIIIALLIVALGVLVYIFYPKLTSRIDTETKNPSAFIQECMEEKIQDTANIIFLQGGDYVVNASGGQFYKEESEDEGTYVKYVCYTDEDLTSCINQVPVGLTTHIESEILNVISAGIENCFNSLVKSYEDKGYDVDLKKGNPEVKIIPNFISTRFNRTLTLVKGDERATYNNFDINLNSNMYEMLEIARNIITWEIIVGDSPQEEYMYIYPYIKVDKHKKENEVRVYVLTDRNTQEVFRFAVRSWTSPVGIGFGGATL